MSKRFKRPRNKGELDDLEVRGLWRAIALSRHIAEGKEKISLEVILRLHKTLLGEAIPEAAGRMRKEGEDVKKLACHIPPPGGMPVQEMMYMFWREFDRRFASIPKRFPDGDEAQQEWLTAVFSLAAWTQHQITAIHPFCDGNGRMARIISNTVLMYFELPPSRLKFEGENKEAYLHALCAIDSNKDYRELEQIIFEGSIETLRKQEREQTNAMRRVR